MIPPSLIISFYHILNHEDRFLIKHLVPKGKSGGRPPTDRRRVLNAIFYILRSGCSWRMLPKDYPKWQTVYGLFRKWKRRGIIKKIHDFLREQVRLKEHRKREPTAMILDSQSVKTTDKRGLVMDMMRLRKSRVAKGTS
jgi:putative transposase